MLLSGYMTNKSASVDNIYNADMAEFTLQTLAQTLDVVIS